MGNKTNYNKVLLERRKRRVRKRISGTTDLIDDTTGVTIAAASSLALKINGGNIDAAKQVGKSLAEKAMEKNVGKVCFDRGGLLYHGRVKALAEAARETGLQF